MKVLALKLSGPFQSWGTDIRVKDHRTDTMPSKSGVVGLLAAALGRSYGDDISDLSSLRFGVRCDRAGTGHRDFQRADALREDGKVDTYIGYRYYLQDACFTACLEGDEGLLEMCAEALNHPIYPIYLGRKACVPSCRVFIGVYDGTLEDVLRSLPDQAPGRSDEVMRICLEPRDHICGADRIRRDTPLSFAHKGNGHGARLEKEFSIRRPENGISQQN